MLYRQLFDGSLKPWTTGAARVYLNSSEGRYTMPVGVYCQVGSLGEAELALLDTGAAWTVVSAETIDPIHEELGEPIRPVLISTRYGVKKGQLHRMNLRLPADRGQDLQVECTCAVLQDWHGPTVLGWSGLLEKLNLALHPGVGPDDEPMLYFGPAG